MLCLALADRRLRSVASGVADRMVSDDAFGRPPKPSFTFVRTRWLTDFCRRTLLSANGARLGESGLMLSRAEVCCATGVPDSITQLPDRKSFERSCMWSCSASFQGASPAFFGTCCGPCSHVGGFSVQKTACLGFSRVLRTFKGESVRWRAEARGDLLVSLRARRDASIPW
jgi:hypothetical protein